VQRITSVTWQVTDSDLCCSVVVTGSLRLVTGGVPVGSLGLFMRFIGVLLALIGVIGHFGA
jgi:hypothetical protein